MSSNPATESSQATTPSSSAPKGSSARLIVLLALLVIAIAALGYDYGVASKAIDADSEKIQTHVDESNRKSVKESKPVTPDEVHKLLGKGPTWVEKHPDDMYDVEYYCAWGWVPVLNMRRHYLAVVYLGDEPRHYSSHYKNERPPIEALPIQQTPAEISDEPLPEPTSPGAKKSSEGAAKEAKSGESAATESTDT